MDIERIEQVTSQITGVSIEQMHTRTRKQEVAWARQLSMYFARQMTKLSLDAIGGHFDRTHATALHACRSINNLLFSDWLTQEATQLIGQRLSHKQIIGAWITRINRDLTDDQLKQFCNNCVQL